MLFREVNGSCKDHTKTTYILYGKMGGFFMLQRDFITTGL